MKQHNYLILLVLIFLYSGCTKEKINPSTNEMIQNDKGWYSYQYKRHDLGEEAEFKSGSPYIILGAYGSGFKIKEDGTCHISYSDGNNHIEEDLVTRNWEMNGNNEILFISQTSEDIKATIVEITNETLWIQYEQSGDNWEYKLRRIE
ncbi:hypothetical protein [Algivirga pacifica]|uniref:Lipocalin-like domain-containing protein n=1 Tax=Algivirga pacifica TaxID=1162670 RepID=A0ABP9D6X9_9BACT